MKLRDWQERAYTDYFVKNKRIYVLEATPGAGKTLFCLYTADQLLGASSVDGLIVVSPTDHLRTQWADKAAQRNLDIDPTWRIERGRYNRHDYVGISITYQQLATDFSATMIARLCSEQRMFVILDEPHHMATNKTWGDGAFKAFEEYANRLLLVSGTLFRSDMNPIPFVDYDDRIRQEPDFQYTYADSLRDGYCRPVFFPSYDGLMEWFSYSGEIMRADFELELSKRQDRERLNTALDVDGNWIPRVLEAANEKLNDVRENVQSDAGGLVVARDQQHATDIANILEGICGRRPVVAISDNPEASAEISRFYKGQMPWIVAVKMVSEGVDIPRLRVGVMATNVTTELFFRQVVGRVVRMQNTGTDQSAFMYIPEQQEYVEYAGRMKETVDHYIEDEDESLLDYSEEKYDEDSLQTQVNRSAFVPISSEAEYARTLDLEGEITSQELQNAQRLQNELGYFDIPAERIAVIARRSSSSPLVQTHDSQSTTSKPTPKYKQKSKMSAKSHKMVGQIAYRYMDLFPDGINPYKTINYWWNQASGKTANDMSMEEVGKKLQWLEKLDREHILHLISLYGTLE